MPDFAGDSLTTADVCRELKVTPRDVHRLVTGGYLDVVAASRFKHGVLLFFSEVQVARVREEIPFCCPRWSCFPPFEPLQ